jgi:hypothetical protein
LSRSDACFFVMSAIALAFATSDDDLVSVEVEVLHPQLEAS